MYTLDLFKEMTQIPRPSGHEDKIRAFLIAKAKASGFAYKIDDIGNVLIQVDGAGTRQDSPTVVLQGHMDMVCEKSPDVEIDFMVDGLTIYEDGGYLKAKGTTLGADNGVGVALAFFCATLENHPPLEILLTVDEEVGMTGAANMPKGFFTGNRIINLDSGRVGLITAGSAGGDDSIITLQRELDSTYQAVKQVDITLEGLKGGHSGGNIGLGRLSASKIVSDLLSQYEEMGIDFRIAEMKIGAAANAIARDAHVTLLLHAEKDLQPLTSVQSRLHSGDGEDLQVVYTATEVDPKLMALSLTTQRDVLFLLSELPHGVREWQDIASHLPRTSANLASIKLDESTIVFVVSYRSFDNSMLPVVREEIEAIVAKTAGSVLASGSYPAWPPKETSILRDTCAAVYKELFHSDPVVVARHVGLECGYWEQLSPGVEVISIGPNLFDLHSPTERVEIASIAQMEELLTSLMQEL
ncbi:beta-Ala-His dipeptidase [Entomospira entomophila]|uniref:Cytosol non-specific dipeptidase n=1 Tax=Entomospira entomophila TaxID=2719988 RepID=A0A968G8I6_9SPIO|nr:beta-Ala-His dipeptidase [Entomospira entomophilus]NIZ40518.1 aminoacyl-histidine dipeptidase [Entomospira entomophilus]WDI36076.1 beta-Ala-His dipeptidase [Entomospira entomophilus]